MCHILGVGGVPYLGVGDVPYFNVAFMDQF